MKVGASVLQTGDKPLAHVLDRDGRRGCCATEIATIELRTVRDQ
jgi:hypothetical protein